MSASAIRKTVVADGYVHKLRLEAPDGERVAITAPTPPERRRGSRMLAKVIGVSVAVVSLLVCLALLAGCGGVSDLTRERVARSETSVQQAQQSIGTSESGAVELQRARDTLQQAQQALKSKNEKQAERLAQQAQLDAELAVAKSQSAAARKAADELLASIETLRQEANRPGPPSDQ